MDAILQGAEHFPLFIKESVAYDLLWNSLCGKSRLYEPNDKVQDNCMTATEKHRTTFVLFKFIKTALLNKNILTEHLRWSNRNVSFIQHIMKSQGTYHGICKVLVQCLQQYSPSTSQCPLLFVSELWWNRRGETEVFNIFPGPGTSPRRMRTPAPHAVPK